MARKHYLKVIGGVTFELVDKRGQMTFKQVRSYLLSSQVYDDIYKAYIKPSATKIGIWHDWCKWYYSVDDVWYMSITSRNCYRFTIGALYDAPHMSGYIHITDRHNYLYVTDILIDSTLDDIADGIQYDY